MAAPRQAVAQLGAGWLYDPRTRGAVNIVTGETVARRQLEKRFGRLAEEGFTSFEAKAKARRAAGLKGFRQVRPGVYEKSVTDPRERKALLRGLPQQQSRVSMLVSGDDPTREYGVRRRRDVWRYMNFMRSAGTAKPMTPEDILSVWDSRASRAGSVVQRPRRWLIRVTIPQ